MSSVVVYVLPIFFLILLGWGLKSSHFLEDNGWKALERITYFVLFPALLISTLAESELTYFAIGPVAVSIAGAILFISVLLLLLRKHLPIDGPAFTSVYQGCVRMNTFIGLSIAESLFGEKGLSAAALAIAIIVPLVNVSCVMMLAWFGSSTTSRKKSILIMSCLKNPLIIASAIGLALNITGLGLPAVLGTMTKILASAALPVGLLAVGAALNFEALRLTRGIAIASSVVKLVVLPLTTYFLLRLFNVTGLEASIAVLFNALPTATSAYILAGQYGGDAQLMARLITFQTLISMISLPIVLTYLDFS